MSYSEKDLIPYPMKNQCYRHYKDENKLYQVLAIAKDVDDRIKRVIYMNTYTLETFSRELNDFRSYVTIQGKTKPRFTLVS